MNDDTILNKKFVELQHDGIGFGARSAESDARPLLQRRLARSKPTSRVKAIRGALALSQEEFASRFQIPLGSLRDWEMGLKDPDGAARAYLLVIARNPAAVTEALGQASR